MRSSSSCSFLSFFFDLVEPWDCLFVQCLVFLYIVMPLRSALSYLCCFFLLCTNPEECFIKQFVVVVLVFVCFSLLLLLSSASSCRCGVLTFCPLWCASHCRFFCVFVCFSVLSFRGVLYHLVFNLFYTLCPLRSSSLFICLCFLWSAAFEDCFTTPPLRSASCSVFCFLHSTALQECFSAWTWRNPAAFVVLYSGTPEECFIAWPLESSYCTF